MFQLGIDKIENSTKTPPVVAHQVDQHECADGWLMMLFEFCVW
ncbi:hypothetical protein B6N60_02155 [Richelia sinica FACHB-800]|uniref:Uncharacterized protein n=1 Tax=Richelia sinica FACHB-800 TaxID=1357546 RepID=A0A975T7R2_9NOST|nr:hypothetical protein B6N60_02155 [Richelia sinica FACHB-800]